MNLLAPTRFERFLIDGEMHALGAMVSLDETHPEGDPMVEGLWAVACIGVEAQEGRLIPELAARWVAAAILTANFGPEFVR